MKNVSYSYYYLAVDADNQPVFQTTDLESAVKHMPQGGNVVEITRTRIFIDDKMIVTEVHNPLM